MNKIKDVAQRLGIITVEDMERYTALELIMMIANKMNEFQEIITDQKDKIQYLLNEGTLSEVEQVFDEWLQDGTFDTLINQSALKKVSDRLDETKFAVGVSVTDFGAVGDYDEIMQTGTDNTNSFKLAVAETKRINGKLIIPAGNYLINENINFPTHVECVGKIVGGSITFGGMDIVVRNLSCDTAKFSGVWRGDIEINYVKDITIDGANEDWGTYWNKFSIKLAGNLTIDISKGSVNQNYFIGGRVNTIHITGTNEMIAIAEAHNNWFTNFDISDGGAVQDDSRMQMNHLQNCYCENIKGQDRIIGNWNIIGNYGERCPNVSINNQILFTNDVWANNRQDYLSLTPVNLVEGGEWDSLNHKGIPRGITPVNVVIDVEENSSSPDGSGRHLKITPTNNAFTNLTLIIDKFNLYNCGLVFYGKGDYKSIEYQTNSGSTGNLTPTKTHIRDGWYLYRVSIPNAEIKAIRLYITSSTADTTNICYLAGIKISPFKTMTLPYFNPSIYQKGISDRKPESGVWRVGEYVMNSNAESGNVAGWLCTSSSPLEFREITLGS